MPDSPPEKPMINNRWLELYGLRYAIGTIVGCGLIKLFYEKLIANQILTDIKISDSSALILLFVAGFGFCYIASAPLLILHVARSLIIGRIDSNAPSEPKGCLATVKCANIIVIWAASLAVYATPLILLLVFIITQSPTVKISEGKYTFFPPVLVLLFVLFIILAQAITLINIQLNRVNLKSWYQTLSQARSTHNQGIVESYRDTREHANAFFIVALEIILALALNAVVDIATPMHLDREAKIVVIVQLISIISVAWVSPSALIWFTASKLEVDFVHPPD